MLTLDLRVDTPKKFKTFQGDIGNVSNLRSLSSYGFYFEGRNPASKGTLLENYPRWSESVRGIVARCLALTVIDAAESQRLANEWRRVTLTIGLRPGGLGAKKQLSMVTVAKDLEAADGTLTVGFEEATGMTGFQSGLYRSKLLRMSGTPHNLHCPCRCGGVWKFRRQRRWISLCMRLMESLIILGWVIFQSRLGVFLRVVWRGRGVPRSRGTRSLSGIGRTFSTVNVNF